jgi:transcriptional regulator with XRE-family HTH domain
VAEGPLSNPNHLAHEQDVIIGGRLREMRRQQNLRLKQVAKEADLSVSMLSQIERGISSPSIRVLRGICHALGVDGAALFTTQDAAVSPDSVPSNPPLRAGDDFVVRVADRKPLSVGGVTKYRVTPAGCSVMEGFLMEIGADASPDANFVLQTGDKIGYVVRGKLRLFVDEVDLLLETGDVYGFPAGHRYRWENGWDGPTAILVINSNHFYV